MDIRQILVLAAVVEATVNILLSLYDGDKTKPFVDRVNWKMILSIAVGELIAFGFQVDILTTLGIPGALYPVGLILSGLIFGRGSNLIHDLVRLVQSLKENQQAKLS